MTRAHAWAGILAFALGAASAACSSSEPDAAVADEAGTEEASAPPGDGGVANDALSLVDASSPDGYPAFRPPVPQVVNASHGPVLKTLTVVPVIFTSDADAASVPDFLAKYAASPHWAAAVAEYGVGALSVGATISLSETPPSSITDLQIHGWLRGKLDGTHPEWGATDHATLGKTVFALLYPQGTVVSDISGRTSCGSFSGFHSSTRAELVFDGGVQHDGGADPNFPILYIAAPRCALSGLTAPETIPAILVHELVETATDPYPGTGSFASQSYIQVDDDHLAWSTVMGGGETADICNVTGSFWTPPQVGYYVSRAWSNASALAYHDPCVPAPAGTPYFNAYIATDTKFSISGGAATAGVKVPAGTTRTLDVLLFSDFPTAPWDVTVKEQPVGGAAKALTLALDKQQGVNGDKLHLTVTTSASPANNVTILAIGSKSAANEHLWFTPVALK